MARWNIFRFLHDAVDAKGLTHMTITRSLVVHKIQVNSNKSTDTMPVQPLIVDTDAVYGSYAYELAAIEAMRKHQIASQKKLEAEHIEERD
jgi:hypothetical protein